MTPNWHVTIATYEARTLLIERLPQVEGAGYRRLIGALAFLFRSEGACQS